MESAEESLLCQAKCLIAQLGLKAAIRGLVKRRKWHFNAGNRARAN